MDSKSEQSCLQIPEPISPTLTTTLLGHRLLKEVLASLQNLWMPITCSGNTLHFGGMLPNLWAYLSGSRLLLEIRLWLVKGTRREEAELLFPPH